MVLVGGFMKGRSDGLEGLLQFLSHGSLLRKALFHAGFKVIQSHWLLLKLATFSYARFWQNLREFEPLDATIRNIFPDVKNHSVPALRSLCRYLIDMDLFDELDSISAPVLFIVGEKDPIIPQAHQIACAEKLEHSELFVFKACGHFKFAEDSKKFEAIVLEWLDHHG